MVLGYSAKSTTEPNKVPDSPDQNTAMSQIQRFTPTIPRIYGLFIDVTVIVYCYIGLYRHINRICQNHSPFPMLVPANHRGSLRCERGHDAFVAAAVWNLAELS